MLIMFNKRTVRLDKETVSEMWIDGSNIVYALLEDPEVVFTLYTAKSPEQAILIYDKITEGWCKNWPECLLQEQTA